VMNAWLKSPKILRVFGCSEHRRNGGIKTAVTGLQEDLDKADGMGLYLG